MSLDIAKESDRHEARWVGSVRPAESKVSKEKKTSVKARGTFLRPFEACPSSAASVLVQG